jgi:hypothetical protein
MAKSRVGKPIDPRTLFSYAEAFSAGAEKLREQAQKEVPGGKGIPVADAGHFAPLATLDSFALELYLKCLHQIDHGNPGWGHKCKDLFDALFPGTQKAVRMTYNSRLATEKIAIEFAENHPRVPMGLDNVLELSNDAFETVRYLYEGTGGKMLFYWPMVKLAVRDTLVAIHPEWAARS